MNARTVERMFMMMAMFGNIWVGRLNRDINRKKKEEDRMRKDMKGRGGGVGEFFWGGGGGGFFFLGLFGASCDREVFIAPIRRVMQ